MTEVPQSVQDAIARNVLKGKRWVMVNMDVTPPVVVKRGDMNHADWLEVFKAVKKHAEKAL